MHTLFAFLGGLSWSLNGWTLLVLASELAALATLPSVLLQRRGKPLSALAWTLALTGVPILGVTAWWALGRTHLRRKRRQRLLARQAILPELASSRHPAPPEAQVEILPTHRMGPEEAVGIFPLVRGNRAELLVDGPACYQAMESAIAGARSHLHLLFYIWRKDATGRRFRDLLAEKARQGVEVRVLLDAVGSGSTGGRFMDPLREAGGEVALFAPTRSLFRRLAVNFRNHRKILVADGKTSFSGGLNIGDEHLSGWHDLGLLIEGPASCQLQEVFLDDWFFATGEECADRCYFAPPPEGEGGSWCGVLAGGPDTRHNHTRDAFFLALTRARERVWITTPYLAPGPDILTALRTAVYRGVDVRLLVPRTTDVAWARLVGRSYYPELLLAGVRIFEYLPSLLHAKAWVFDSEEVAVGSANLDNRSFRLNFECTCFLRDRLLCSRLSSLFKEDLGRSEEVTVESLRRRGKGERLLEAAANLLSPMM